jgi:acylglycerol lipase
VKVVPENLVTVEATSATLPSGTVFHSWSAVDPVATVVVQHGIHEKAHSFVSGNGRLIPHLLDAGYDVVAMDLWGHGCSPGRRGSTSLRRAAEDHREVVAHAARSGRPVFLLGYSLGGVMTAQSHVEMSADEAAPVAGIVLVSPAFSREVGLAERRAMGLLSVLGHKTLPGSNAPGGRPVSVVLGVTAADGSAIARSGAADWTAPTLVVHGTADRTTDPVAAERFADSVVAEDVTFLPVQGAGHAVLDADDGAVVRAILAWLAARR